MTSPYPVGSLVSARNREWVVLPESDADVLMVRPLGGAQSEETGILLALEGDDVREAHFELPDPQQTGDARSVRLLHDALRLGFRSSAGPFRSFGRIAVTPRAYQLVPLLMALKLDPVRLLIADDVGIGKTIEALLIARELIDQGTVSRTTVLCSPQLAEQWQREMKEKFHLDAALVLSSTAAKLERRLAIGESLFEVYPHTVVSTDYIKSDRRRDEFLRAAPELIIVDEAHTCVDSGGARGRGTHQRHQLLKGLAADATRHLLLVTATPHSGKEEGFRNLLALLDDSLAQLPDDLSGPRHEDDRRHLSRYFIQRKRRDIRDYLDEETTFPKRETTEETYQLTDDYRRLFDRCLDFARESVLDESGGTHRQRVRWWSALALLRSLASSPAAAGETLRNRAAPADTDDVTEADQVGQRTVLDLGEDESLEAVDVPPGSDYSEEDERDRVRRRLLDLAREADALVGANDAKLTRGTEMITQLVDDGFDPIVFCRFIPTADYVADALRDALPDSVEVAAVTGQLPPSEREARVRALGDHDGRKVLVATDCMSEGINLQEVFDAVLHYDLSWNPTRHEQREGRVDRFGQPSKVVRTVTYWGDDTRIDGLVLDVLIRKHEQIRKDLGISVPVPIDSKKIVEALMEGLLLRGRDPDQLQLDFDIDGERRELFAEWEDAAEREKRSQTMFAQRRIHPEEVRPHLHAVRDAIGTQDRVEALIREVADVAGAVVADRDEDVVVIDWTEARRAIRDLAAEPQTVARFELPVDEDVIYLSRTHPLIERLASYVMDTALDPRSEGIAARCGAMRANAVERRTTVLLARFRYHLVAIENGHERPLLAEDAKLLAFEGDPAQPTWLKPDTAAELATARPAANITTQQATDFVQRVIDGFEHLEGHLHDVAHALGDKLEADHRTVRDAARRRGITYWVEPHLPPDVLGIWVLLPAGGAA